MVGATNGRAAHRHSSMLRRGFTLVEVLLTLTLAAMLLLMAVPRLGALRDGAAVRLAMSDTRQALDAARGLAIRGGATVLLDVRASRLVVHRTTGDTAQLWSGPHPVVRGVALAGLSPPLRFGRDGLATGVANRTLRFQRGRVERQVVLSRLGRIR